MRDIYITAALAAVVCLVSGPVLIPFLRRLKFGQHIRTEGPKGHLKKAGTPTMGGLMFFLSLILSLMLVGVVNSRLTVVLFITVGFGLIGFFDDFIKVVMKRPLGLRAWEKMLGQIIMSSVFAYVAVAYQGRGTDIIIPGMAQGIDLGWLYIPFVVLVMVSVNNAVNLTDGLDGLAAGVTIFSALAYLLITRAYGQTDLCLFSAALIGTCIGFLFFNIHPARLFMGDTGSLALGGALGALAVFTKTEILLPFLGGVYVLETLSVILQVGYFKLTKGKRLFLMAPLHHHFELYGWSENRVVFTFWTAAAFLAVITVMIAI